jgi:hypothetical protein
MLQVIRETAIKMGLEAEEDFVLRVVQLSELLAIRHCVFLMGPTGSWLKYPSNRETDLPPLEVYNVGIRLSLFSHADRLPFC